MDCSSRDSSKCNIVSYYCEIRVREVALLDCSTTLTPRTEFDLLNWYA